MKSPHLLIVCQAYPNQKEPYKLMYAHTRNKEYVKQGLNVTVVSFSTKEEYTYEGIKVLPEGKVNKELLNRVDLVACHAPNIRNHLRFLILNCLNKKSLFFIHGHEVLDYTKYYFGRYDNKSFSTLRVIYEKFKLLTLRLFISKFKAKLSFIYVSQWMKEHFYKNLKLKIGELNETVINNSVDDIFLKKKWSAKCPKLYDFVTIRPLDEKKYAIDVVITLAKSNPEKNFLLYGKGNVFEYIDRPSNLEHKEVFLQPKDIPQVLDQAKAVLMPTRLDAQGVMVCEMASYGIPVVTSDIPICKEVLGSFNNVHFINNEAPVLPTIKKYDDSSYNQAFKANVLIGNEISFFEEMIE